MKNALKYIPILLLLGSCTADKQSTSDEMPPLHSAPVTVALNINEGYSINPLTGDSINPIINRFRDTLRTGVPLPVSIEVSDPALVAQAEAIPAGKPRVVSAQTNVRKIPEKLTVIPVDVASLKRYAPGTDTSSFALVNSTGDTLPTGVPVPVVGKEVPCIQPQPVKALPPRIKRNAIINIRHLDLEQGMNSLHVQSILEDSRGNLWFGTDGGGVCLYNGETFRHYTEMEGLSDYGVWAILEDSQGNLWFGTDGGGVIMYNGDTFTHITEKEGLGNNRVTSIIEDSNGDLWFGTNGGGAVRYNGKTFTHFTTKEGLSSNSVAAILEDRQGNLWFGTIGGGVNMYDGKILTRFSKEEGLSSNSVSAILEDSRGNLWFGTEDGGVNMFNGEAFTHLTEKKGLGKNNVSSILEDRYGNIWFGTNGGGVSRYNGKTFANFSNSEGLSSNWILSMMEDSHGNIWFGTLGGGVNVYKTESFTYLTENESAGNISYRSILEDSRGNIWLGADVGGVSRYNGESFTNFTQSEGLCNSWIKSILEDRYGNLWFGTNGEGAIRYDGETFTHISKKHGLNNNIVRSVFEDSRGNLWFGTREGISFFNDGTFAYITGKGGSSDYSVWSIMEDSHGNIWFGTHYKGAIRYNGETFMHFTEKEGLCNNTVFSLLEDSRGNLWFGTREGVSVFNGETFTHYTDKQGLCYNSVMSILEDRNGNIWLSTDLGLSHVMFDTDSVKDTFNNPEIYAYSFQDGLKSIDFYANSVLLDSKNRIWWASNDLTVLDLNSYKLEAAPPSDMQLNRIEINEQFADFRHLKDDNAMNIEFDSVAKFYNFPLNLKLPYRHNHLSFHYSAIDWSAPHKLLYSHKMEGLGDNWSLPSAESKADYRNLPHGTFTFKVRAIGAAKKWSEIFEYTFTIRPPWWYSWWAYLLYGFILIGIVLGYRRFLLNRAKIRTALEVERVEKEKIRELDHMKSRFFANISHEFRTPLTLLLGPIEDLLKSKRKRYEKDKGLFKLMQRNARRLQLLINQLLDLSKLETGKVKLQVSEGDLTEFIRAIVLSFLSLAESKKIDYQYDIPRLSGPVYYDDDKIEKILTNLISNAFKFTPENGKISFGLKYVKSAESGGSQFADIRVSDNGKGIPGEKLEKIFNRFYQVSDSDTRDVEGTGIGLALTKELVDLYHGEISVESDPDGYRGEKGSTFRVRLPVSIEQFKEGEIVTSTPREDMRKKPVEPGSVEQKTELIEMMEGQTEAKIKGAPIILIVEDNIDLCNYIAKNLGDSYQILAAENGKKGLELANESIPDLVISDLMMPVMDGLEMCSRLKEDERTSHIPIILLTAKADKESKLEGLETGADDYLTKPFDSEELLIRIRNLIRQRKRLQDQFNRNYFMDDRIIELQSADERFLEKAKDIIERHLSDPSFNAENFSQQLGISRMQLHRKLKGLADQSPGEFIQKLRLKHSRILLNRGVDNIAQIAYQVGFSDPSYYARCFRQLYGVSPSEYASEQRNPSTSSS